MRNGNVKTVDGAAIDLSDFWIARLDLRALRFAMEKACAINGLRVHGTDEG